MIKQISIHTDRAAEQTLRQSGFSFPAFPEQGDVMFNGEKVGFVSNFNGVTLDAKFKQLIRDNGLPFWNLN